MPAQGSDTLDLLHVGGYWTHILLFFGLLNYLPISKHFHVITAIPNVFLANLNKGTIKPVRTEWMIGWNWTNAVWDDSRHSRGSTCWISTPALIAADAATTVLRLQWAVRSRLG